MADDSPFPWDECLGRVRAGDQRAARDLVEVLKPAVFAIVRGRLPRGWSDEDLAQEVFMKVFSRLGQYRHEMPFPHWVARIAVNTCIDGLRRRRSRPEVRNADLSESEERKVEALHASDGVDVRDRLEARELVGRLLKTLPPKERLLIEWIDLEQRSTEEVCALTGWSRMVLKVRVFRARRKLRAALETLERKETR